MTFEEETLYPALDRIPGVPHTPGAMAADHDRIKRAIDLLETRRCSTVGSAGAERLHRPLVVDVHARIRARLDTEEFLYGPLLSRLDPHEYARLYRHLRQQSTRRIAAWVGFGVPAMHLRRLNESGFVSCGALTLPGRASMIRIFALEIPDLPRPCRRRSVYAIEDLYSRGLPAERGRVQRAARSRAPSMDPTSISPQPAKS